MVADLSLGLQLGERVRLGKDSYTVVGVTRGMTSASGDGMAFFSLPDAQAIQFDEPGEAIRLQRNTRVAQLLGQDLGQQQPVLVTRASGLAANLPAFCHQQSARCWLSWRRARIARAIIDTINGWPDLTVYTQRSRVRPAGARVRGSFGAGSWDFSAASWWSSPPSS